MDMLLQNGSRVKVSGSSLVTTVCEWIASGARKAMSNQCK